MSAREGWHIERTINVGHVLTTITLICTALWWANQMDTRLTAVETRQAAVTERLDRQDQWNRDAFSDIKTQLSRIEDKLDGKADK